MPDAHDLPPPPPSRQTPFFGTPMSSGTCWFFTFVMILSAMLTIWLFEFIQWIGSWFH